MTDRECVEFLQWALPQLGLRWPGFPKVRRQVHKRIVRRLGELGLGPIAGYRAYLDTHAAEWGVLDAMSRISISRFYRDRQARDDSGGDARTGAKFLWNRVRSGGLTRLTTARLRPLVTADISRMTGVMIDVRGI